MSKIFLDMGKYKKISTDKHTTTLRHADGHEIKLAHGALSPKIRSQLHSLPEHGAILTGKHEEVKMADGGVVADSANYSPAMKENYSTGRKSKHSDEDESLPPADDKQRMSVKMMAEGGDPVLPEVPKAFQDPNVLGNQAIEQDESEPFSLSKLSPSIPLSQLPDTSTTSVNIPEASPDAQQASIPEPAPRAPAATMPPSAQQAPLNQQTLAPQAQDPGAAAIGANKSMLEQGLDTGLASAQAAQKAETAQGLAKNQAADHQAQQLQELDSIFKQKTLENEEQIKHAAADAAAGHINPNHYMESQSTGQRVMTAIGLIIGGLGGSDAPVKFLQQQIDRDIEAQKANLGQKNNVLAAYQHQFHNIKDAADMAKATQVAIYGSMLDKAASTATDQMAKARALDAKSKLYQQYAPMFMQMNMRQTLMGADSGGHDPAASLPMLRQFMPEVAKERESRIIAGTGIPTPQNPQGNEISKTGPIEPAVRAEILAKTKLINATQHLRQFAASHPTINTLSPADRAVAETLLNEVQQSYRQGVGASTSEGEQKLINQITGANPLDAYNMILGNPKLKALEDSIGSSLNQVKKLNGLPEHPTSVIKEQSLTPQQRQFADWAKANPGNRKAALILKKLGLQ